MLYKLTESVLQQRRQGVPLRVTPLFNMFYRSGTIWYTTYVLFFMIFHVLHGLLLPPELCVNTLSDYRPLFDRITSCHRLRRSRHHPHERTLGTTGSSVSPAFPVLPSSQRLLSQMVDYHLFDVGKPSAFLDEGSTGALHRDHDSFSTYE